jgi:putrescine aminotransferase
VGVTNVIDTANETSAAESLWDRDVVLERYRRHVNIGLAKLGEFMHLPLEVRSEGSLVFDEKGEAYLDCGGYGVFILGHRHPAVVQAVRDQLDRHPLATRVLLNPDLARSAETLARVSPPGLDYVFFTNSGTEAAEAGIKIARLNGKHRLIATHGGFHGKSMGALSVTGRPNHQDPFKPLLPDVEFIAFGDADALQAAVRTRGEESCVIIEPVQAEGGVNIPPPGYLRDVERICRDNGAFFICDEIQTGLGRLGAWWGVDREGVKPDAILVGKNLSGSVVPVGACVSTAAAWEKLNRNPLLHTSTFGGNPLAMAAAHAAITTIESERIPERARVLGEEMLLAVRRILDDRCPDLIVEVRGMGLLIAIEFKADYLAGDFMSQLLQRRVVVSHSLNTNRVMRLTPPAVLTDSEKQWLFDAVMEAAVEMEHHRADFAGAPAGGS